jgi:prophage antirepressor-like protein
MSAVIPFGFDDNLVRVVQNEDGEPWFVGKDVATVLEYARPRDAIKAHCKGAAIHRLPTSGGMQDVTIIPERDVYRLIMRSNLPAAERFEEWVVSEVLPSIRKRGAYAVGGSSQPERPALPAVPILTEAALGLRPNVRAQVLSCAVQAAKMEGGSPELIDHYFQKYSEMVGATRKPSASDMPKPLDAAALAARERDDTRNLILSWIEDESFEIPRHAVRKHREQAQPLYWEFTQWCRSRGEEFIPGAHGWGREMKKVFPHKLSNVMYYYLVRPECQSATLPIPKPEINPRHN